jgi:hypothetical protein
MCRQEPRQHRQHLLDNVCGELDRSHLDDITQVSDHTPAERLDTLRCQHSLLLGQRRQRHPALPPEMIVG